MYKAIKRKSMISLWWKLSTISFFFYLITNIVSGEGSLTINQNGGSRAYLEYFDQTYLANAGSTIDRKNLFWVYANVGEKINLGSSALGTGAGAIQYTSPTGTTGTCTGLTGRIANITQETAGPLPNIGGYNPCIVTVGAGEGGIWKVIFISPNQASNAYQASQSTTNAWTQPNDGTIVARDITVRTSTGADQNGRVFANYIPMIVGDAVGTMNSVFYIKTIDGYLYDINLNGITPFGFVFFSNNDGIYDAGGLMRQSVTISPDNDGTLSTGNIRSPMQADSGNHKTHKIFLNTPSSDLPMSAPSIIGTQRLDNTIITPEITGFIFHGAEGTTGQAGTNQLTGKFTFYTNIEGDYSIDVIFSTGVLKTLSGHMYPGTNIIPRDGLDNSGSQIPATLGSSFLTTVMTLSGADVHFPFIDVENHPNGFILRRLNGLNAPDYNLYYNDTPVGGSSAMSGINSSGGAHGRSSNFGNLKIIDTRGKLPDIPVTLTGSMTLYESDLSVTISHTNTLIRGTGATFLMSAYNSGPSFSSGSQLINNTLTTIMSGVTRSCQITAGLNSGSACGTGTGNINIFHDIASGQQYTYTISGTLLATLTGTITTSGMILRGIDNNDPTDPFKTGSGNNTFVDSGPATSPSDLRITKTANQSLYTSGNSIIYTIFYRNSGIDTLPTYIIDILPAGITGWSANTGTISGGSFYFTGGDLAPGGSGTIILSGIVTATGGNITNTGIISSNLNDILTGNNRATISVSIAGCIPIPLTGHIESVLSQVGVTSPNNVIGAPNGTQAELGNGDSMIVDLGNAINNGTIVTFRIGRFSGGGTASATIEQSTDGTNFSNSQIFSDGTTSLENFLYTTTTGSVKYFRVTRTAQTIGFDGLTYNYSGYSCPSITDLSISKSANTGTVQSESVLVYQLLYSNNGPSNSSGVVISDPLPSGLTGISASTGTITGGVLTINIGTLTIGQTGIVTITGTVIQTSGIIINTGYITGNLIDSNTGNNNSSVTTLIGEFSDGFVIKSVNTGYIYSGTTVVYTITYGNIGTINDSGIIIDTLPTGFTFLSSSITGTFSGNTLSFSGISLLTGSTGSIIITGIGNSSISSGLVITNTVLLTGSLSDNNTGNNFSSISVTGGVIPTADLGVNKVISSSTLLSGHTVVYTIYYYNSGPNDTTGFITDIFPPQITVISHSLTGQISGNIIVFSGVFISAGSSGSIIITGVGNSTITSGATITNTVSISGAINDPNTGNNTSSVDTTGQIIPTVDLSVSKTVNSGIVYSGSTMIYEIFYVNSGIYHTTGTIIDTLPTGFTLISSSLSGSLSGNIFTITGISLSGGTTGIITLTGVGNGNITSGSTITNTVTISGTIDEINTGNNFSSVSSTGTMFADLIINKTVSTLSTYSGTVLSYTITYINLGVNPTTGTIIDILPTQINFVSSSITGTISGNSIIFSGISFPVGVTGTIIITGMGNSTVTSGATITNTVSISGEINDPNTGNNTDTANTFGGLVPIADLSIEKLINTGEIFSGTLVTYTIHYANSGPQHTTATIIDTLPTQITFLSSTPIGTISGNTLTFTGISINSGSTGSIIITGVGNSTITSGATITNTVSISGAIIDSDTGNNFSSVSATGKVYLPTANLGITKTVNLSTANSGDILIYTINFYNSGPDISDIFVINDIIPNTLTGVFPSTGTINGGIFTFTGYNLGVGQTGTIIITGTIQTLTGIIVNYATISGNLTDPNTGNNTGGGGFASTLVPLNTVADLSITKSVSTGYTLSGETIIYTLNYQNHGPYDATGVILTDNIPINITNISISTGILTGNNFSLTIGNLNVGETGTVIITGTIMGNSGIIVTNTGEITGNTLDINTLNNSSSTNTTIILQSPTPPSSPPIMIGGGSGNPPSLGTGTHPSPTDNCPDGDYSNNPNDGLCNNIVEEIKETSKQNINQTPIDLHDRIIAMKKKLKKRYVEQIDPQGGLRFKLPYKLFDTGTPIAELANKNIETIKTNPHIDIEQPSRITMREIKDFFVNLADWVKILPFKGDHNADEYLIIPRLGIVTPIVGVEKDSIDFEKLIDGGNIKINTYLQDGVLHYPNSANAGEGGNMVIAGHSSYWKNDPGRYHTIFTSLPLLEKGDEIRIYKKDGSENHGIPYSNYKKHRYFVQKSFETTSDNTSVLGGDPRDATLTLFTCVPIGGSKNRRIVSANLHGIQEPSSTSFIRKYTAEEMGYKISSQQQNIVDNAIKQLRKNPNRQQEIQKILYTIQQHKDQIKPEFIPLLEYLVDELVRAY